MLLPASLSYVTVVEKNHCSVYGSYIGILFSAWLCYSTNQEQVNILVHVYMQDILLAHSSGYTVSVPLDLV